MSRIEWTDETWNPTVGCSKVSDGCTNCYAIRVAARGMSPEHHGLTERRMTEDGDLLPPDWTGEVRCLPERLDIPLRWRKPRRVFVDSMSDLFHPSVPDDFIARVWAVMALAYRHTFQVLTKRPVRMAKLLAGWPGSNGFFRAKVEGLVQADLARAHGVEDGPSWVDEIAVPFPLPNVWLGTSVEDQHQADRRIPHLLATPAAVRFLSCEPLLGPIDLTRLMRRWRVDFSCCGRDAGWDLRATWDEVDELRRGFMADPLYGHDRAAVLAENPGIDWCIVGGESGPGARPMHPDWARGLRDQCVAAGVPFFFKQWGGRTPKGGGRILDGRTWDEWPGCTGEETR